ncbi:MAG: NAD(P)H-hydrate epimerase [Candidatus Aenigmarchaeota archaeon]|nr:NAD(P)H-hydrate epimerase [Candidatus Aenigmarchaeota archaeon]NIP40637.1 NAD(P)H-hydrate epimerase [Candidatus Aenigmarchaeota archaeon]NIQ17588.1 NAD(P)H-hydrate epimerase [Candidatus Aenigmarchaeota archaeon]NIS73348.1 NAD(P)H-hydrate epimerase [Candidatus Aenigmarchaeota archaeon]
MISVKKIREVEKKAEAMGISEAIMMENAGANVARILNEKIGLKGKRILVFCGTGNNAGDGLVFARHSLVYGAKVDVYFVKDPKILRSDITRKNFGILGNIKSLGKPVKFYVKNIPRMKYDILVDALLGTGLKEIVSEEYAKVIEKFNSMEGFKTSIDCPSGINSDNGKLMGSAVKPDLTITLHDRKRGLNPGNSGEIIITDMGIPKI